MLSARFFSKTSQRKIHAFSTFGRRLNALCCLVFAHTSLHVSQKISPPSSLPGGLASPVAVLATDAGPLINTLVSAHVCVSADVYGVAYSSAGECGVP